jgi:hypothetical protein
MSPETVNIISIFAGIFSIAISVVAIGLSIVFYFAGRKTEISVTTSLAKIEAQTDALQKLSGKQIDKLMKHAFDGTSGVNNNEAIMQLMSTLSQIPLTITTILRPPTDNSNDQQTIADLYAALYFYTAQANYWSQYYLPAASDFDDTNEFHNLTKRIIDLSNNDFQSVANWLGQCDQRLLAQSSLSEYLNVTKDRWRHNVKSSSEVFIASSHT